MSLRTATALQALQGRGYICVPYGEGKILVKDGADFVVVPLGRVIDFLQGVR